MRTLRLLPLVLFAVGASACAAKSATTVSSNESPSTAQPPPRTAPVQKPPADSAEVAELPTLDFKPIYYELDSATLKPESRQLLDGVAEALRRRPEVRVTISGHTCELGTTEYNLALGQRRAAAVRDYLRRLGVDERRMSMVSYGEESPAVSGSGESVWSKNRRSEFSIAVSQARAGGR
ncbi:MAG TPA: OmpA family protein [Myxococcaceae bacterium]|jgi:peptidoglycan-associated lipoprotein